LLAKRFRALDGVDVSREMVEGARREHPDVNYSVFDGRSLPFVPDSFDVAFEFSTTFLRLAGSRSSPSLGASRAAEAWSRSTSTTPPTP
jgi:Methyltransferase domain